MKRKDFPAEKLRVLREEIVQLWPQAMLRDVWITREKVVRLFSSPLLRKDPARVEAQLKEIIARLEKSVTLRKLRRRNKPRLIYPRELPIISHRPEIVKAIKEHQVIIVSGETGCGKSTQLPKMCLEAGRGEAGRIACTQPRRLAATTIAQRIAEELGQPLGQAVGYKIRFADQTSPQNYIKIMTDGMLLAEAQADRLLTEYDTIIIDEAHERSLNIDFLLGLCRQLLEKRSELKLIITSATLEIDRFTRAFNQPPVFHVSGRLYPVEVMYFGAEDLAEKKEEGDYIELAVEAVDFIKSQKPPGDILVFMPTEQDILDTCQRLQDKHYPDSVILPLFARMPAYQQKQVYHLKQGKIVVATNVAETSLTIPGIKYVVDTGLARTSQYHPASGIHSLPIMPISKASAEQRKGRCGRVMAGLCLRLYSEENFHFRPDHTPPEILRSNLAEVILRMLNLGLGDPFRFPFIDPPTPKGINDGYRVLTELAAVEKTVSGYELTSLGRRMARLPVDPRLSRMLLEAEKRGCLEEVTIIAAVLSIPDPHLRPLDKAAEADRVQSVFKNSESDFLSFLNLWEAVQAVCQGRASSPNLKKFSRDYFLSYNRLREWLYVHEQIMAILEEQKIRPKSGKKSMTESNLFTAIHKSILSGFVSHVAARKEKWVYETARRQEATLWPGSALLKKPPSWVVAAEMIKTNRLYLRTVGRIQPEWVEEVAPHIVRYTYDDLYWDKNRGEVRAKEKVSYLNLTIISDRDVGFGPQDPPRAHQLFIREGVLNYQVNRKFPFLEANQKLIHQVRRIEEKLRCRQIMVPEENLFNFYSSRLPGIFNLDQLERKIRKEGGDAFLWLKEEDLYLKRPDPETISQYPDSLKIRGHNFSLLYHFAPGEEDDGVTLIVPANLINQVSEDILSWPVPGMLREKVEACLKALPKEYRKLFSPLRETVARLAKEIKPGSGSFFSVLSRLVYENFKVNIPEETWEKLEIPRYLRMRLAVVNTKGQVIMTGRYLSFIKRVLNAQATEPGVEDTPAWIDTRARWERDGLKGWDQTIPEIPEEVVIDDFLKGHLGLTLVSSEPRFAVKLYKNKQEASGAHLEAIEAILGLHFQKDINFIRRSYNFPEETRPVWLFFGGEETLKTRIIKKIKQEVFRKDFRKRADFQAFLEGRALKLLFEKSHVLFTAVSEVLMEYLNARNAIRELEETKQKIGVTSNLPQILHEELEKLVPKDFVSAYPSEFIAQLPRMLRALGIRAERGKFSTEKDQAKAARLKPYLAEYERLCRLFSGSLDPEKARLLFELRWMIEEFKVSLFAPEIKTAFPVSPKRLEIKINEIEKGQA